MPVIFVAGKQAWFKTLLVQVTRGRPREPSGAGPARLAGPTCCYPVLKQAGKHRWPWVAVMVLGLIATTGCGSGKYSVEGKVVYKDGAPCTAGLVLFESLDPAVKTSSRGHIQKDGSFFMSTERERDGVPAAHFRVVITPLFGVPGASGTPIHEKYWRPETSPLEYTVVQGKNEPTFEMDRASPKQRKVVNDPE